MNILVTGGYGFIGSNFVKYLNKNYPDYKVIIVDKLTYASINRDVPNKLYIENISNKFKIAEIVKEYNIEWIVNFAAETHVDTSITCDVDFVQTNILGTHALLQVVKEMNLKMLHISTDEVYGSPGRFVNEAARLDPCNPYSATKASADLLITCSLKVKPLNVIIARMTNNYGIGQYVEKLIPKTISLARTDQQVPVYGSGLQMRDWLYIKDSCEALSILLHKGRFGEIYNISTQTLTRNIDIVKLVLDLLGKSHSLISYVKDREAHDFSYMVDSSKFRKEFNWKPSYFDIRRNLEEIISST